MVVSEIVAHATSSPDDSTNVTHQIVRWVMVLRVLGIVRLLSKLRPYQVLFSALSSLRRFLPRLMLTFAVVFVLFGVTGMRIYGGKITCVPSDGNDTLVGLVPGNASCDDDDNYVSILNFNDFVSAEISLFAVVVSGDWGNLVDNYLNVSSQWLQLYWYRT